MRMLLAIVASLALSGDVTAQHRYKSANGRLRVALAQQPLGPNGPSKGTDTMANGGIQMIRGDLDATVRVERAQLTPLEQTEYGGWKKHCRRGPRCASEAVASAFRRTVH